MPVRIDKWLQVARAFKTRSQATKACTLGRVRCNGTVSKPHRALKLGDEVEVRYRDWTRILVVRELRDRPLAKAEASRVYEDLSPPRPVRTRRDRLETPVAPRREAGAGRPTKRQRREVDRLRGR